MKKAKIIMMLSGVCLLSTLTLASCGGEPEQILPQKYQITIKSVTGVTVTADTTSAELGETVTLTVSEVVGGKEVKGIKVGDMTITANDEGQFKFVMPGKNVEVEAILGDILTSYLIKVTSPTGANVTTDKGVAKTGDVVTVSVNVTNTLKEVDKVLVDDVAISTDEEGKYRFLMPGKNVDVTATLKDKVITTFSVTKGDLPSGVSATIDKETATVGEKVDVVVAGVPADKELVLKANDVSVGKGDDGVTYSFIMPNEAVTISGTLKDKDFATPETYALTLPVEPEDFTITANKTEGIAPGEEVILTITETSDIKRVTGVNVDGVIVAETGEDTNTYKFNMPSKDVTIKLTDVIVEVASENMTYTLTIDNDYSTLFDVQVCLYTGSYGDQGENVIDPTEYNFKAGQLLDIWFINKQGDTLTKEVKELRSNITDVTGSYVYYEEDRMKSEYNVVTKKYETVFRAIPMLEGNTTIELWAKTVDYNIEYKDTKTLYFVETNNYLEREEGEKVVVTPVALDGNVIDQITVKPKKTSAGNVDITPTKTDEGKWEFLMPAYDVVVSGTVVNDNAFVGVTTDEHVTLSNFRTASADTGKYTFGPGTVDEIAYYLPYESNLYFDWSVEEGYMIDKIVYVDEAGTEKSISTSTTSNTVNFKVPRGTTMIKATSKVKYVNATLKVQDASGNDLSSEVKVTLYEGSATEVIPDGKFPNDRKKILFEVTSKDTENTTTIYDATGVTIGGKTYTFTYTDSATGFKWSWIEAPSSESVEIVLVVSKTEKVLEDDSPFVGSFGGGSIVGISDYYGEYHDNTTLKIKTSGEYQFSASYSGEGWGDSVLSSQSGNIVLDETGSYLVDETNSVKIINAGDWVLYSESDDITKSALMKKDTSSGASSIKYATLVGDSKVCLVRYESSTWMLIDFNTNTMKSVTATVTGTAFKKDSFVTINDGTKDTTYVFASGTTMTEAVFDGLEGTYTGNSEELGKITLDGLGGAKLSAATSGSFKYEILEGGTTIKLTGKSGYIAPQTIRTIELDKDAKTYTISNVAFAPIAEGTYVLDNCLGSDGVKYQFNIIIGDDDLKISIVKYNEDGTVGSELFSTYYLTQVYDLTKEKQEVGIYSESLDYLTGGDTFKITINDDGSLLVNATAITKPGQTVTFTLVDQTFTLSA